MGLEWPGMECAYGSCLTMTSNHGTGIDILIQLSFCTPTSYRPHGTALAHWPWIQDPAVSLHPHILQATRHSPGTLTLDPGSSSLSAPPHPTGHTAQPWYTGPGSRIQLSLCNPTSYRPHGTARVHWPWIQDPALSLHPHILQATRHSPATLAMDPGSRTIEGGWWAGHPAPLRLLVSTHSYIVLLH